ncbi:MAG: GatB/YqeY domain-containing protein [Candidatus Peribacteria bacterium]|jgi:uncharacterized protein YqeY|nr:GatB/YqeY domain-containing protein [Candidatus Peribacteria bacterium]
MSLLLQITNDYQDAMKAKATLKKLTLNYLLAQAKNKKIELQHDLTDEEVIALIKKEIKAINESISFLEKVADKAETLAEEQQKKQLLEAYLPAMLSREQTETLITSLIAQLSLTDLKTQRGVLMKELMAHHKAELDTTIINEIITSLIQP